MRDKLIREFTNITAKEFIKWLINALLISATPIIYTYYNKMTFTFIEWYWMIAIPVVIFSGFVRTHWLRAEHKAETEALAAKLQKDFAEKENALYACIAAHENKITRLQWQLNPPGVQASPGEKDTEINGTQT